MKKLEDIKRDIRNMIVCDDNNHPIECSIVKLDLITFEADVVCSGFECENLLNNYNMPNLNQYAFIVREFPDIHEQLDINLKNISKLLNKSNITIKTT